VDPNLYQFVKFLHVLSVLVFMFFHGVSAFVMMMLRRVEQPEQARTLIALRNMSGSGFGIAFILVPLTGIIAGSMASMWSRGWIGTSLVLFIALTVVMSLFGRRYIERVAAAVGIAQGRGKQADPTPMGDFRTVVASGSPGMLAGLGFVVLAIILWLMIYKPF
jgi:hypothetical protein